MVCRVGFVDLEGKSVVQMLRIGDVVLLLMSDSSVAVWEISIPDKPPVRAR